MARRYDSTPGGLPPHMIHWHYFSNIHCWMQSNDYVRSGCNDWVRAKKSFLCCGIVEGDGHEWSPKIPTTWLRHLVKVSWYDLGDITLNLEFFIQNAQPCKKKKKNRYHWGCPPLLHYLRKSCYKLTTPWCQVMSHHTESLHIAYILGGCWRNAAGWMK